MPMMEHQGQMTRKEIGLAKFNHRPVVISLLAKTFHPVTMIIVFSESGHSLSGFRPGWRKVRTS